MLNTPAQTQRYLQREQSRLGRIVNRVDNALVVAGAALTFSRKQVALARESNRDLREVAAARQETKAATQVLQRVAEPVVVARQHRPRASNVTSRVDTGRAAFARADDMER